MKLKAKYDSQDQIPEGYADLYTQSGDAWVLTGIEGIKSQEEVERIQESLRKEREDHKQAKDKLRKFGDLDPDEVHAQLDEIDELRAKAESGGAPSDTKIQELVDARVKRQIAPIERERDSLRSKNEELSGKVESLSGEITRTKIHDKLRSAGRGAKVVDSALDDILMAGERLFEVADDGSIVTRDGAGISPGLTPELWLGDMKEKRPHWWPASQGAGARGNGGTGGPGANPWSKDNWSLTEQGKYLREHGTEKAEAAAKAAGSRVGATSPAQ